MLSLCGLAYAANTCPNLQGTNPEANKPQGDWSIIGRFTNQNPLAWVEWTKSQGMFCFYNKITYTAEGYLLSKSYAPVAGPNWKVYGQNKLCNPSKNDHCRCNSTHLADCPITQSSSAR